MSFLPLKSICSMNQRTTFSYITILHCLLSPYASNGFLSSLHLSKATLTRRVFRLVTYITNALLGNFAVIGSFLPEIEIWDLDVLDVLEPIMVLGNHQTLRFLLIIFRRNRRSCCSKEEERPKIL